MTALNEAAPRIGPDDPTTRPPLRIDRIAWGILLAAAGAGWFLATFGIAVPWRLAAPVALTLVGTTLTFTVVATRDDGVRAGRSGLAWLGAALLVLSVALGINAPQYVAPAGNVRIAPAAAEWPMEIRRSVGNVEIDLTRHPLPDRGIDLGATRSRKRRVDRPVREHGADRRSGDDGTDPGRRQDSGQWR